MTLKYYSHVHTKTCTQVFIASLFIINKTWKQLKCPSVGEWTNKSQYIQTIAYYSMQKKKKASKPRKDMKETEIHITM